jgi:hypothetical protein
MLNLEDFTSHTGTIESVDNRIVVKYTDNNELKTCFLNATTKFIGAIDDRLALKSLRADLSVNVWLRKDNIIANYASPNWC